MRQRIESAMPALVMVGFAIAAITVNLLLTQAQSRGVDALEEAVQAEVDALAATRQQDLLNTFQSAPPLLEALGQLEMEVGSESDGAALADLLGELTSQLEFGYYLVDERGTITQGFRLEDPEEVLGERFEWPGYDPALFASPEAPGGLILPAGEGLTTPLTSPVLLRLPEATAAAGLFVLETPIGLDAQAAGDMAALERGETGEYRWLDPNGVVIDSNVPGAIGEPVTAEHLVSLEPGVHRAEGDVVIVSEVQLPSPGPWRVVFNQDTDEFESPLAQPVESAGRIIVFLLLLVGLVLTLLLVRRLRAARDEQERLRRLNEAQQELISIVSHELRTPVAGVLGFLETTVDHWDGMDDAERRQAVERAVANARRLQAMTRDVLDTQRVEAGQVVNVTEPLDLAEEVRLAAAATRDLDPDRAVELDLPAEPVWVRGDADRIQQVLANLLENARKNSPAVEPIEVVLEARDDSVELAVTDHGAGIEPEQLERIFEKFVRGRDEGVTGTGLGLYISRQIVDAHGGRIWAESEAGTGATFRVLLPRASAPDARDRAEPEVVND